MNIYELIAAIKDLHLPDGDKCSQCQQVHPCRTYAYVDGILASRFEDGPVNR